MDPHIIHSLQNERYLGTLLPGSFIKYRPFLCMMVDRMEIRKGLLGARVGVTGEAALFGV
jgi:hypothetical protein